MRRNGKELAHAALKTSTHRHNCWVMVYHKTAIRKCRWADGMYKCTTFKAKRNKINVLKPQPMPKINQQRSRTLFTMEITFYISAHTLNRSFAQEIERYLILIFDIASYLYHTCSTTPGSNLKIHWDNYAQRALFNCQFNCLHLNCFTERQTTSSQRIHSFVTPFQMSVGLVGPCN